MSYAQAITYIEDLPPIVQMNPRGMMPPSANPYYEEVVKDHPNIQSKIRQTDTNYFGKYEETMPYVHPTPRVVPSSEGRAVPYPEYPLKASPPSALSQNYVGGGMVARDEEQHLPVAQSVATHYIKPMVPQSTYPVVEHLECSECKKWQSKCEWMYWIIIGVLVIVVLVLLRKVKLI